MEITLQRRQNGYVFLADGIPVSPESKCPLGFKGELLDWMVKNLKMDMAQANHALYSTLMRGDAYILD